MVRRGLATLEEQVWRGWWRLKEHRQRLGVLCGPESPLDEGGRERASLLLSKLLYHLSQSDYDASISFALRARSSFYEEKSYSLYVDKVMVKGLDGYLEMRAGRGGGKEDAAGLSSLGLRLIQESNQKTEMWRETLAFLLLANHKEEVVELFERVGKAAVKSFLHMLPLLRGTCSDALVRTLPLPPQARLRALLSGGRATEETATAVAEVLKAARDSSSSAEEALQGCVLVAEEGRPWLREEVARRLRPDPIADEILSGRLHHSLFQHFLVVHQGSHSASAQTMAKGWVNVSTALEHTAAVLAHGLVYLGTGRTELFQSQPEWASLGQRWSEFSNAASMGLLFRFNHAGGAEAIAELLQGPQQSAFTRGGQLLAQSLLQAELGRPPSPALIKDLLTHLYEKELGQRVGASLALGVAAIGSHQSEMAERILSLVDDAVVGSNPEGGEEEERNGAECLVGGISVGLVMLASAGLETRLWQRLYRSVRERPPSCSRFGQGLGLVLMAWGRGLEADGPVQAALDPLLNSEDWEERRVGVLLLSSSLVGSGNAKALARLLRCLSGERRAEVRGWVGLGLGLLMAARGEEEIFPFLRPLLQSHCSRSRHGAAMGMGLALAGTASKAALSLLTPLLKDEAEMVRGGALVAAAMIFCGSDEVECPEWLVFAEAAEKGRKGGVGGGGKGLGQAAAPTVWAHAATVALGLVNAGSRNVGIRLRSGGRLHDETGLGLFLFCLHWDWVPLANLIALALRPLAVFALQRQGSQMNLVDLALSANGSVKSGARVKSSALLAATPNPELHLASSFPSLNYIHFVKDSKSPFNIVPLKNNHNNP